MISEKKFAAWLEEKKRAIEDRAKETKSGELSKQSTPRLFAEWQALDDCLSFLNEFIEESKGYAAKGRQVYREKIVESMTPAAERAKELRAEGISLNEIARCLMKEKYRTYRGHKRWTPQQVKRVIELVGGKSEKDY